VYFILDRSGSMTQDDKWNTIRSVVASAVSRLGPRIAVGAAVYPTPGGPTCGAGAEVFSVRQGTVPSTPGKLSPTAWDLLTSVTTVAGGGTPTAATVRALTPELAALPGKTFVVLATDGGPDCNPNLACDASGCIPNIEAQTPGCTPTGPSCCTSQKAGAQSCLDGVETEAAVAELRAKGVPVYVIGVPGSGPYSDLLDKLAVAGGTARSGSPAYYRVDSTDTKAFSDALAKVAAEITATCALSLKSAPTDASLVNVYLDGVVLPEDPKDGWKLDGATITLLGAACDRVLSGDVLDVRVVEGCPTVLPN
jgi:hypothetical protein